MAKFKYLQRLARRWGGSLNLVTQKTFDNLRFTVGKSPVQDKHGVDYPAYAVYVVKGNIQLPNIIHELGHIFATPHHPNSGRCTETHWLGWEFLMAKRLGILQQWYDDYELYGLGTLWPGSPELGELSFSDRRAMLKKAIRVSRRYGVVHRGKPVPHPERRCA